MYFGQWFTNGWTNYFFMRAKEGKYNFKHWYKDEWHTDYIEQDKRLKFKLYISY